MQWLLILLVYFVLYFIDLCLVHVTSYLEDFPWRIYRCDDISWPIFLWLMFVVCLRKNTEAIFPLVWVKTFLVCNYLFFTSGWPCTPWSMSYHGVCCLFFIFTTQWWLRATIFSSLVNVEGFSLATNIHLLLSCHFSFMYPYTHCIRSLSICI